MRPLRDIEKEPSEYNAGSRVRLQKRYYDEGYEPQQYDFCDGTIKEVGVSTYNSAYDWYVIEKDDGEIIESWWMTAYKIVGLVEQSGSPSQEA